MVKQYVQILSIIIVALNYYYILFSHNNIIDWDLQRINHVYLIIWYRRIAGVMEKVFVFGIFLKLYI